MEQITFTVSGIKTSTESKFLFRGIATSEENAMTMIQHCCNTGFLAGCDSLSITLNESVPFTCIDFLKSEINKNFGSKLE